MLGREMVLGSEIMKDKGYLPYMILSRVDPDVLEFILTGA